MDFPPLLKSKYDQCDRKTKLLFDSLIEKTTCYCSDHRTVDMKEYHYRLQKKYPKARGRKYQNYCLFTLTPFKKGVTIHLRTDGYILNSSILEIIVILLMSRGRGC